MKKLLILSIFILLKCSVYGQLYLMDLNLNNYKTPVNTISESDGIANMKLLIEVKGLAQLSRLLARLEQQPGIISARRLVQGS